MTFTFSKIIFTWVDTCPLEEYDWAIWNRDPVLNQNCNRKYLGQKNSSTFSTQGLAFLSIGCIRGSLFSCSSTYAFILWHSLLQTLPKAQRTQRLSAFTNVTMQWWNNFLLQPLQLNSFNLDKTSTSKFHCSQSCIIDISLKTRSHFLGHLRHKEKGFLWPFYLRRNLGNFGTLPHPIPPI